MVSPGDRSPTEDPDSFQPLAARIASDAYEPGDRKNARSLKAFLIPPALQAARANHHAARSPPDVERL